MDQNTNSETISKLNQVLSEINISLDGLNEKINAHKREGDERMNMIEQSIVRLEVTDEEMPNEEFSFSDPLETMEEERWDRQERAVQQINLFNQALAEEERDEVWATEMESSILIASQNDLYSGSTFSAPNCKSTFCQIEAYHEDEESRDEFESIRREMSNSYHIQHFEEGGEFKSVVYFIKHGEEPSSIIFQTLNEM